MVTPIIRQATIPTSTGSIFTVPTGTTEYISKVIVCNATGGGKTYSIWLTSGASPTSANAIIYNKTLNSWSPLNTDDVRELSGLALPAGWTLWAKANGSGVSITIQTMSV